MGLFDRFKKSSKSGKDEKNVHLKNIDEQEDDATHNSNAPNQKSGKTKNFKYLDKLIHNGSKEIALDADIILGWREEKKYLDGIKIDVDDLIIDGNGHAIDAKGLTRIFECTAKNITIENITLRNAFAKKHGGAIYNSGELNIIKSAIIANTAKKKGNGISYGPAEQYIMMVG